MDKQYIDGLNMRKQVMGEEFVEKAFGNADEFTMPLQEFITRNAWGTVWCRDGLALKTRSLITVAMLAALGRGQELKGHLRGAINNGAQKKRSAKFCSMQRSTAAHQLQSTHSASPRKYSRRTRHSRIPEK